VIFTRQQPQLGGLAEDIAALVTRAPGVINQAVSVMNQIEPYLPTVMRVLEDPALPTVVARVNTIRGLEVASAGGVSSNVKGVGLAKIVPALDAYIWYRKNPWVPWAALGLGALAAFKLLRR